MPTIPTIAAKAREITTQTMAMTRERLISLLERMAMKRTRM